jgi:phosphomannomutase
MIDTDAIRPLKVVLDGGNGMAGPMVGPILEQLPLELIRTYWKPDGEFPDHEPNPLLPENREFIIAKVRETGADLGIAWDGDADRCFFIDGDGEFVPGDFVTALLAASVLEHTPGADILYDVRASRAVPDTVQRLGGNPLINRVGTRSSRPACATRAARSAARSPATTTSRPSSTADSGTIPALLILELLSSAAPRSRSCSRRCAPRTSSPARSTPRWPIRRRRSRRIRERYGDGEITELDGISVDYAGLALQRAAVRTRSRCCG